MSSLDKLKQTLEEEATADIQAIQKEAEQKVAAIQAAAQVKAEKVSAEILAGVEQVIEEANHKAEAEATLIRRRVMLTAKAALLDAVMAEASTQLANMPDDRYRAFLTRLLTEAASVEGPMQVVFNENDRTRLGERFLESVEKQLSAAGRHVQLNLAPEPGTMSGGFRLVGPDFEVDSSLERLLHMAGELYEPEIARTLFHEGAS